MKTTSHMKLNQKNKGHNKRIPVMSSESPVNDLNPDLRDREKSSVRNHAARVKVCACVCVCESVSIPQVIQPFPWQ